MMDDGFKEQFNTSIDTKDWSNVINLGEAYIAQHGPSYEVVYNLGLAYMAVGDSQMAVSLFLSLPRRGQKYALYHDALSSALSKSGRSMADLDMGAHGLAAITSQSVNFAEKANAQLLTSIFLPILLGLIILRFFAFKKRAWISTSNIKQALNLGVFFVGAVVSVLLLVLGLSFSYRPTWCGVISEEPAVLRDKPANETAGLTELKGGTPVMALGSLGRPWLYILESGGSQGWIDALQVRCVSEKK